MVADQQHGPIAGSVRLCLDNDQPEMARIINAAAIAYRGVIPDDRWHDPYMPEQELASEIANGVVFSGYEIEQRLVGVMGIQHRRNARLIRHAYILPAYQGRGIGSVLIEQLCRQNDRPVLVGTWRAAEWAIRFYERHGFTRVADEDIAPLLRACWTVSDRQIATSVVLSAPALDRNGVARLITG